MVCPILPPSLLVTTGDEVIFEKIIHEPTCEVGFRHSYNKGRIREMYRLRPETGELAMVTGYFENCGAGMLDTTYETVGMNFRIEGSYFVLDFPEDWKKEVHYIGGNIAKHHFTYGDTTLELGEERSQRQFTLSIARRSLWQRLRHRK